MNNYISPYANLNGSNNIAIKSNNESETQKLNEESISDDVAHE